MQVYWVFTILINLLLSACVTNGKLKNPYGNQIDEYKQSELIELSSSALPPAVSMNKEYFKKSYPKLSDQQFNLKWLNSTKSPLMFIRSFVNTWYDEVESINIIGPVGACLGDPHPENFGYLWFGASDFEYVYNDLDDSGACPVAFDALRYFTTLKLFLNDPAVESELLHSYIHYLNGKAIGPRFSEQKKPNFKGVSGKTLKSATQLNLINRGETIQTISEGEQKELFKIFQESLPGNQATKLLDAVNVIVSSGGSAGLLRFWLLVESPSFGQQLIEFKELVIPGAERGRWVNSMRFERDEIIPILWQQRKPNFFGFASYQNQKFLIRSRIKAEIYLDSLPASDSRAVLEEQVWLMAQLHRKTLAGTGLFEEWLARQAEFMSKRYNEALLAAKTSQ